MMWFMIQQVTSLLFIGKKSPFSLDKYPSLKSAYPISTMEKEVATVEKDALCCGWNYCGQRLAVGFVDVSISIHNSLDDSSSFSSKWKAHVSSINTIVWLRPEFGDAIACISADGSLSLWEEVEDDTQPVKWKMCKLFESSNVTVLDLQFGVYSTSLKMVAAYSDGHVKVYELLDPLELNKW